jgi:TRAP-type C4-dicarboxylate transport system substrate-binding protein
VSGRTRFALAALGVALITAQAWGLTIKIGSVAPIGSPWDNALHGIAADWSRITGGQVELKTYMGGIAGDEPDMLRKIRIGQLQGAAVTSLALNQIVPDVLALSTPFLIETDDELDYVLAKTGPDFVAQLQKHGLQVLALSKAGWVRFFSRRPIYVPDDLKRMRLAVNAGEPQLLAAWVGLGFDAVPLGIADTMVALQSGMVDAAYGSPLLAAGYQWFGPANHMSSLRVAPVLGAIVVSDRVWQQVPAGFRAQMLESVAKAQRKLYEDTARLEAEALRVMQEHGLIVDKLAPQDEKLWRAEMDRGFEMIVGKAFSRAIYEKISALLKDYRAGQPAPASGTADSSRMPRVSAVRAPGAG